MNNPVTYTMSIDFDGYKDSKSITVLPQESQDYRTLFNDAARVLLDWLEANRFKEEDLAKFKEQNK